MAVNIVCGECGVSFRVSDSRAKTAKYCSKACYGKSKVKDESKPPKVHPCKFCGVVFKARFRKGSSRHSDYCSMSCRKMDGRVNYKCDGCGVSFSEWKSEERNPRNKYVFCSSDCKIKNYRGEICSSYKGGRATRLDGRVYIRSGHRKYRLEHRVVIENYIGRKLKHGSEPVLHINGKNDDNRISNLYICSDMSELATILTSHEAPYPVKSNLDKLKLSVENKNRANK